MGLEHVKHSEVVGFRIIIRVPEEASLVDQNVPYHARHISSDQYLEAQPHNFVDLLGHQSVRYVVMIPKSILSLLRILDRSFIEIIVKRTYQGHDVALV